MGRFDELSQNELTNEFRDGNIVLLCGAGISMDYPTSLPSGDKINQAFDEAIRCAIHQAGLGHVFLKAGEYEELKLLKKAIPQMPERILGQFHNVFGDDLFKFLDGFFAARPNHNHYNIATLAHHGFLPDIITLNFDFAIETAFQEIRCGPVISHEVFFKYNQFSGHRVTEHTLRIHKPHGTLWAADAFRPATKRYRDIIFTIERLGTALNQSLVDWFQKVIGERSVLVTGYSADDLDILPALQQAMGPGRVYWNHRSSPKEDALWPLWLEALGSRAYQIRGDVHEQVLKPIVEALGLNPHRKVSGPKSQPVSLQHIASDTAGIIIATALLLHNTEERKSRQILDQLVNYLDSASIRTSIANNFRKEHLIEELKAGRDHENGNITDATTRYHAARMRMQYYERHGETVPEAWRVSLDCNVIYNQAWILKRPQLALLRNPKALFKALRAMAKFFWQAHGFVRLHGDELRALSAYYLADFSHTYGMLADLAAPANPFCRLFYAFADWHYRIATRPVRDFVPQDVFHLMRRDEMKMLRMRSRWLRRAVLDFDDLDKQLALFDYTNLVMRRDAAFGTLLMLRALRKSLENETREAMKMLKDAFNLYEDAKYGSGMMKVQMYCWILSDRYRPWWETLLKFSARRKKLLSLRQEFALKKHKYPSP